MGEMKELRLWGSKSQVKKAPPLFFYFIFVVNIIISNIVIFSF